MCMNVCLCMCVCVWRWIYNILCVMTFPTNPISPSLATALCAALGPALCRFVQPRNDRAQYRFRASWLAANSWKYMGRYVLFSVYVPRVPL